MISCVKWLFSILIFNTLLMATEKPNILIIYADDLGYGDLRCYNPNGKIPTPHIDKLAAQGMMFTDAHSSSGVCTPSRYTLLTGRYHWRTRLQKGIVNAWGSPLIAEDRMTIGMLGKQNGYHTACIGKWHLGWNWAIPPDKSELFKEARMGAENTTEAHRKIWHEVFSKPIAGGPITRGFDSYFGTDVPNWPPFCFIENDRTVGIPSEFLSASLLVKKKNLASMPGPSLKDWSLEPILPTITNRAIAYINQAAKTPEPFLLYFALTSPHTPLSVNDAWKGKSGLNPYADLVMETDTEVGRVLEALEKSGQANQTLVIFSSDNGCAHYAGAKELEENGHFPSGPLRGYKSDAWEGGHRVPFIVSWKGVVKAGAVSKQLVHQADIIRTFAEIIGAELPDNAGEDSFSLMPLLKGDDIPIRHSALSHSIRGVPALRNGQWKYIPNPGSGGWTDGGDKSHSIQLYNLAEDIGETKNLAISEPEKVREMKELLEKIINEGRSTPGVKQQNDVEVLRHMQEP
jgi:arylsulfatase A